MKLDYWVLSTPTGELLYKGNQNEKIIKGFPPYHLSWLLCDLLEGKAAPVIGTKRFEVIDAGREWNKYVRRTARTMKQKRDASVKPMRLFCDFRLGGVRKKGDK